MSYLVAALDSNDYCFLVEEVDSILPQLEEDDISLDDVTIYEVTTPVEFVVKLVRKNTLVRKEK